MSLRDAATGNTPLMYAAIENKLTIMEKMIGMGCAANATNKVHNAKKQIKFPLTAFS